MKKILAKIKANKLLFIEVLITILGFITGILLMAVLSNENKDMIKESINTFFQTINDNNLKYTKLLYTSLTTNLIVNIIIWLLGISIIGIPIVIIILFYKSLMLGFTISSLLFNYKLSGIILTIIYIIPYIINLFLIFIMTYHSVRFSLTLFKYLFKKGDFNKKNIVSKYIKLLTFLSLSFILSSLIETYIIPFIIKVLWILKSVNLHLIIYI